MNEIKMHRIPLKEYKKPRVLAVDFSENDIKRINQAGYHAKRAFTGLFDNNEYCIPTAIQDIEIVFLNLNEDTFHQIEYRQKHINSTTEDPDFNMLIREIWDKRGWTVIFVSEDSTPHDLKYLYIEKIGILKYEGKFFSASESESMSGLLRFPKFKGSTINIIEDKLGNLLKRFFKSANWILMTKNMEITFQGVYYKQEAIIADDSFVPSVMAIKLYDSCIIIDENSGGDLYTAEGVLIPVPKRETINGGIIILPDFGKKNVDIGLTLIQEYFYDQNPLLYSTPKHEWLADYRPEPIKYLYIKRQEIIEDKNNKIKEIEEKIEKEEEKYSWLDRLLIGKDDDFKSSIEYSLKLLGFKVEDVDNDLSSEERKREDFRITDPNDKSFYIVEVKTTKRGASEDFITKTQNHQGNYSRENNCPIPDAILIINHSYDLEPSKRNRRFYTNKEIQNRLKGQHIKAIDSIVLHDICQKVLAKKAQKEKAREFIKKVEGAISGNINFY